jgi:hypothetical protein
LTVSHRTAHTAGADMHWLWEQMESPITDVRSVRRRTNLLVAIHLTLTAAALAVLVLVVWRIRLLVTLTQRSNVETLILAFVVVFVLYLLVTTLSGTRGALVLLGVRLLGRDRAQRWLQRRAERERKETKKAYLNVVVQAPGGGMLELPIEDGYGRLGTLRLDGAEVALVDIPEPIANSPLALAARVLGEVGSLDGTHSPPRVVAWAGIDEELAERYGSQVRAFKRLEGALGATLWPAVRLDGAGVERIAALMREAAPELREDLLLPDIEYSAEFTIPIIPEPLAFMQVKRSQEHADPVATIGCATLVVLSLLAVVAWVIVNPPWVPEK